MPETTELPTDEELNSPTPPPDAGRETFSNSHEGLREAARDHVRQRVERGEAEERADEPSLETGHDRHEPPIEIEYLDKDKAPEKLSPRQAAKDLGEWREQQRQQALQDLIGEQADQAPQDPGQQQPQEAPQQPQQPTPQQRAQAELQQAQYVRQQYESALGLLMQNLAATATGEFSDIKTMADVQNMARKDWPRYVQWDAHQKQVAAVKMEMEGVEERRRAEQAHQWSEFATREDRRAQEAIPELRDPQQRGRLQSETLSMLRDYGVTDQAMQALWRGEARITLRSAPAQRILADAARWRAATAKARSATAKPLPPVQRPGVSGARPSYSDLEVNLFDQRLARTGNIKDAARLLAALRRARR